MGVMEARIRQLLMRSGSTVNVILESRFPGRRMVGGKYTMGSHTVTLYLDVIKEQCMQLFGSLDGLEAYTAIVFAHELGHAEDEQLSSLAAQLDAELTEAERAAVALRIEENAWQFAAKLLNESEQALFPEVVYYSLKPYHDVLETISA